MAQTSRFWSTDPAPAGDQQTSYSQADFADVWRGVGEGVIIGHPLAAFGELSCSDGGDEVVDVATGTAIVDGVYFESTAVENIAVPAAVGVGNTRIDRIVVRVTWASFDVAITRIAGTDAASPTAPAITQTSETTYDLSLCQVLVNTSGNITVTDERTFFPGDNWITYTPSIAATPTSPVIGNGTITGRYSVAGKMVTVHVSFVAGATTTFGDGAWNVALPFTVASTAPNRFSGTYSILDFGGNYFTGACYAFANTSAIYTFVRTGVTTTSLTASVPMTWAVGDSLWFEISYEMA